MFSSIICTPLEKNIIYATIISVTFLHFHNSISPTGIPRDLLLSRNLVDVLSRKEFGFQQDWGGLGYTFALFFPARILVTFNEASGTLKRGITTLCASQTLFNHSALWVYVCVCTILVKYFLERNTLGNVAPARNQRGLILNQWHHLFGGTILSFYSVG